MWWLKYLIEFIILFIVCYLFYFIINYVGKKKINNESKRAIAEVKLFINLYHIDMKKISYKKLSNILILIISFNLSLTVLFAVELFDNIFLKIGIGFVILVLSMYLGYSLLGLYYKRKGMTKNVQS